MLLYHLVHGMDGVYLISSYSRFCFPNVAPDFIYYGKVKSALKAELLIFSWTKPLSKEVPECFTDIGFDTTLSGF